MDFPLLLALLLPALLLVLLLALLLAQKLLLSLARRGRPGIVRAARSEEATDRNPAGAPASVMVVARVAHSRHGRPADTSPAQHRCRAQVSARQVLQTRSALLRPTRQFRL